MDLSCVDGGDADLGGSLVTSCNVVDGVANATTTAVDDDVDGAGATSGGYVDLSCVDGGDADLGGSLVTSCNVVDGVANATTTAVDDDVDVDDVAANIIRNVLSTVVGNISLSIVLVLLLLVLLLLLPKPHCFFILTIVFCIDCESSSSCSSCVLLLL